MNRFSCIKEFNDPLFYSSSVVFWPVQSWPVYFLFLRMHQIFGHLSLDSTSIIFESTRELCKFHHDTVNGSSNLSFTLQCTIYACGKLQNKFDRNNYSAVMSPAVCVLVRLYIQGVSFTKRSRINISGHKKEVTRLCFFFNWKKEKKCLKFTKS